MLPTVTYLVMKPRSRRQRRSEQLEGVLVVVGVVVGAIALAKVMVAARNGIMSGQMTMAMGFRSMEMLGCVIARNQNVGGIKLIHLGFMLLGVVSLTLLCYLMTMIFGNTLGSSLETRLAVEPVRVVEPTFQQPVVLLLRRLFLRIRRRLLILPSLPS